MLFNITSLSLIHQKEINWVNNLDIVVIGTS
jgi:hypothetical protein